MKRLILAILLGLAMTGPTLAMDHGKMKGGMDHSKMAGMDHSKMKGQMIRESTVDGHKIMYHLIDNVAEMAKMGDMKGHDMSQMKSHHLMIYIADSNGAPVDDGKVGFKVTAPDGADQKTMAMAMTGGFGADVDMKGKGAYTIKTKAIAGEAKLIDEFEYEVK